MHTLPFLPLLLSGLLLALLPARAQRVEQAWVAGYAPRSFSVADLAVDAQGNTYTCGTFSDSATFGSFTLYATDSSTQHKPDVYVAKYSPGGVCVWATRAGGYDYDDPAAIVLGPDGAVYVTGRFSSYDIRFGATLLRNASAATDLFVARLNGTTGQWQWARRAGGDRSESGKNLCVDAAGNVYVSGSFVSASVPIVGPPLIKANPRWDELLVAKLDGTTGQWLWATRAGVRGDATPALQLDAHGRLFVGGAFFNRHADFGPLLLTTHSLDSVNYFQQHGDAFVARLNAATGQWQWATQAGANGFRPGGAAISDLVIDAQGGITAVGGFSGADTVQIGPARLVNHSLRYTPAGNPFSYIPSDVLVARLDSSGQWLGAIGVGGPGAESLVRAIREPLTGKICLLGILDKSDLMLGTNYLRTDTLASFLAQLNPTALAWDGAEVISFARYASYFGTRGFALDGTGRRYLRDGFKTPTFQVGSFTVANPAPPSVCGFVARLGAGPLAVPDLATSASSLRVWPNPATTSAVQVSGAAPGEVVWLCDALGRMLMTATMPADGSPFQLRAPLAMGLYSVRVPGTRLAQRLIVE